MLPLILGAAALIAGVGGVGSAINGGIKMKEAADKMYIAKSKKGQAVYKFERKNKEVLELMDSIGKQELEILSGFEHFSNIIGKIQGKPKFKVYAKDGIELPIYEAEELQKISTGAEILLGALSGTALGTAGGFAAAGATTSAVMALGAASTGTAISTLTGVAATNATLAALGGGSLAVGGGGMALGSIVLGGATLGVGLLIGGIIFSITGNVQSEKADEAYKQAEKIEREVNRITEYLKKLGYISQNFKETLSKVERVYKKKLLELDGIVNCKGKTNWNNFSDREKKLMENTVLLVGLLYKMCNTHLVLKSNSAKGLNEVNTNEIYEVCSEANSVVSIITI